MKEFFALEKVIIRGRGILHIVDLGPNESVKPGEEVVIDGEEYLVTGIEKHCISDEAWKMRRERRIGILTKDLTLKVS